MQITVTRAHQVVQDLGGRRRIISLAPGPRVDGPKTVASGETVEATEVTNLKRLIGEKEYAKLVKDGVIEE